MSKTIGGVRLRSYFVRANIVRKVSFLYMKKAIKEHNSNNLKEGFNNTRKEWKHSKRLQSHEILTYNNLQTSNLKRSNDSRGRLLSHCKNTKQLLAAEYVWNNPQKMKFIRHSPLGEGKDMTIEKNIKNIAKKIKRHVDSYNIYEYSFKNETWIAVVEVLDSNQEQLYSVYKKE